MLNLPIGNDMHAVQTRVRKLIATARDDQDCLLLQQLWCLLRNAEKTMPRGDNRSQLHQMRHKVHWEMTALQETLKLPRRAT